MSKSKPKFYVVWVGVKPGIYKSWNECKAQITGYQSAKYKAFKTMEEAKRAYKGSAVDYYGVGKPGKAGSAKRNFSADIDKNSISVDAACSGNPGLMEYRGVITTTGKEIFKVGPLKRGTNNLGEFLGLVHALAYLKKLDKPEIGIYTDSRTAMAWVRNKKIKTTLSRSSENEPLFKLVDRALDWLNENSYNNRIIKWDTANWGEIPADFGRK